MIFWKTKRAFEEKWKAFFLVLQELSFRFEKQTSKNVADTTFKYVLSEKKWYCKYHNFGKIRIDSEIFTYQNQNYLPIKKILAVRNVIMLIKSVVNKNKIDYFHNTFLEKDLHKDMSSTQYFQIKICIL